MEICAGRITQSMVPYVEVPFVEIATEKEVEFSVAEKYCSVQSYTIHRERKQLLKWMDKKTRSDEEAQSAGQDGEAKSKSSLKRSILNVVDEEAKEREQRRNPVLHFIGKLFM